MANTLITFKDEKHLAFYHEKTQLFCDDCYFNSIIYLLGLDERTRKNWLSILGRDEINIKCLKDGWQTDTTKKICRMAFNLFNDCASDSWNKKLNTESYTPIELFCCEYGMYFVEAIKIRYPSYMNELRSGINEQVVR